MFFTGKLLEEILKQNKEMKTSMAIRDTTYRREVMEIPRVWEGGSQSGRCEPGLESRSKQAFRGL